MPSSKLKYSTDRLALIEEINSIVEQQVFNISRYQTYLLAELEKDSTSHILKKFSVTILTDIEVSLSQLKQFLSLAKNKKIEDCDAFILTMVIGGFVLKRSIAIQTSLLRHSPALRGIPSSLDYRQSITNNPKLHTVDYLRGGYIMYQQPGQDKLVRYEDHPILAEETAQVIKKLYGADSGIQGLAYTSGIGAADSILDVMDKYALQSGLPNFISDGCWIEIKSRLKARPTKRFSFFKDKDLPLAITKLCTAKVQSIFIEPIQNYPKMLVVDIDNLAKKIAESKPKHEFFIIIDHVMTFDFNIFEVFDRYHWPPKMHILVFISGIKFVQNGYDCAKAGFVFFRSGDFSEKLRTDLLEGRAGSGRAPSFEEIMMANIDTQVSLKSRMRRYDRNIAWMATKLADEFQEDKGVQVISPWIKNHLSNPTALNQYGHGGRVIYLRLISPGDVDGTDTLELYRHIADEAANNNLPIMAASNFGFSTPHIHVVRHEGIGISIRVSPGSVNHKLMQDVTFFIIRKIQAFSKNKGEINEQC